MKLSAIIVLLLVTPALGHDGEHDEWLKTLKNGNKVSCCDASEAFALLDPDWEIAKGSYRVRQSQRHQWIVVDPQQLVTEPNKIGVAKVWPTMDASGTWTSVRCFLPGNGA